ncbi:MAG TPA: hypothetical protein VJ689_04100 [Gaiellaceae bacterium]|nr:hypothetical protein [Gaiellaceae bacterium]
MARPRYPRHAGPRPDALPPETRTIGQDVAEAIRLYGKRFWHVLPLGVVVAVADQISQDRSLEVRVLVLCAAAPFLALAYTAGCALAAGIRPERGPWLTAVSVGTLVFLPAAFFFPWFALLAVAWLGVAGWVVPIAVIERRRPRDAIRRSLEVARADLVHALGGLATLAILFGVTRLAMGFVLRSQADNTIRTSIFLADLVVSPLLYLGGALIFIDLAARVGSAATRRRSDADLSAADDPH